MNLFSSSSLARRIPPATTLLIAIFALRPIGALAASAPAVLDDFSDAKRNSYGIERLLVDDKGLGGQSQATQKCANGVLTVEGELVPGRGVPAFISLPLLLSPDGKPRDLSGYEGIRLRVKIKKGNLSVQASSSEIQNFDYHSSAPILRKPGEFQEVRIPFKEMKRAWSEQTALNLKAITSVNLVAFGVARDAFAYEVAEIGFY